jgi:hypothetical protein
MSKTKFILSWLNYRSSHFVAFICGVCGALLADHFKSIWYVIGFGVILFLFYAVVNYVQYINSIKEENERLNQMEEMEDSLTHKIMEGIRSGNVRIIPTPTNIQPKMPESINPDESKKEVENNGFDISHLFNDEG